MNRIGTGLVALAFAALPVFANGITYDCSSSLSISVCTTLQTTIAGQYASVFTNANSVIYVQMGNIGKDVGENVQFYGTVDYASYYAQLTANASGTADSTAISSLGGGTTNPVVSGDGVAMTSSLAAALGFSGSSGICTTATDASCNTRDPSCTLGQANCYNDIITISSTEPLYYDTGTYISGEYDFFTTVEHETDEALGTSSCLVTEPSPPGPANTPEVSPACDGGSAVSAADLFRYSASGTRSFFGPGGDQADANTLAYFSINGGVTNLAPYNNSPNGGDYGDFSTNCTYVQDADGCNTGFGTNILNDGGVEIAMLDAVGYNEAPEPGTIGMLILGLGLMPGIRRKTR